MVPNNSSQETMTRTNASTPGSPKYETTIPTTGSWRQEALNSSLMISSQNSDEETAESMKIKASKSPWHWKTFYKHRSPWSQASSTSIVYLKVHRTTNPKSIHWKTAICCCREKNPSNCTCFLHIFRGYTNVPSYMWWEFPAVKAFWVLQQMHSNEYHLALSYKYPRTSQSNSG